MYISIETESLLILEEGVSISGILNFYGLEKENLFSKFSEEDEKGSFNKKDLSFFSSGTVFGKKTCGSTVSFGTKKKSTKGGNSRVQF